MRESAEHEMVQHGVVQHHDSGRLERIGVNLRMQPVITQMIQIDIGVWACPNGPAAERRFKVSA